MYTRTDYSYYFVQFSRMDVPVGWSKRIFFFKIVNMNWLAKILKEVSFYEVEQKSQD